MLPAGENRRGQSALARGERAIGRRKEKEKRKEGVGLGFRFLVCVFTMLECYENKPQGLNDLTGYIYNQNRVHDKRVDILTLKHNNNKTLR